MGVMNFLSYIREAVSPGGTPKRYLIWVCIVLALQTISSVVPAADFFSGYWNLRHWILAGVVAIIAMALILPRSDEQRNRVAFALYIVGLIVSTVTISLGITALSGIIFMLTWAMTLFVAERREYISFDLVTVFMVLMLISSVVLLMYHPNFEVEGYLYVLATGAVLTAIDIYLVYIDFDGEKNFYRESRQVYTNMQELSERMSEILSAEGQLDHLLWQVSQQCIPLLDLEDCVIYLFHPRKNLLLQVAAYGNKSQDRNIVDPLEIHPGEGIVGRCFATGQPVLVKETKSDPDYIVDDMFRNSELAIPIISNGSVVGVIDSEHSQKGYFKNWHVQAFSIIASFCGIKITEYNARESIEQARQAREETEMYKELDELKNRFITNISHDLKTPLSLIKGPAAQIIEESKESTSRKLAQYILKNTEHLLRVVNQLLQLNRVDKGLNELYLEDVQLTGVLQKIVAQYEGLANQKRIQLEVHCEQVLLTTDVFRLEQIVHNLLHNAFRYSGTGGSIKVEAVLHNDHMLHLSISDTGDGIPDHLRDKVFERFFKADVNNHEGTGIGLSLVKEYTQSIGGTIRLDASYMEGARFVVELPVHQSDAEAASLQRGTEELAEEDAAKPIMVVVEDHPDLNNFICDYFEERFHCYQCFDGKEGLRLITELQPDIVISDLMMPDTDGNAMIRSLKQNDQLAHIPVVVLTAKAQTESKIELYESGVENYLVKPFDIQELNAIVGSILEQRKRLRETFRDTFFVKDSILDPSPELLRKNALIEEAVSIIHEQLDNSAFSIADLALALGVGRNKLQREMRERTGLTPVEFIRSVRLLEAKRRIEETNASISEIAYSVGFNNLSYFTRSFKAEFDCLPKDIRPM